MFLPQIRRVIIFIIDFVRYLCKSLQNKQNALHIVSQSYYKVDKTIIDLLIEKGVDITCQDKVTFFV